MFRTTAIITAITLCLALLLPAASAQVPTRTPKVPLPYVQSAPGVGRMTMNPHESFVAESQLMSGVPALFDGLHLNEFLGANSFYSAGIRGQGTTASTIEPGHIWSGHTTLPHVTSFTTGTGALGETDRHATAVGMAVGGRKYAVSPRDHQTGIAMDTDLRSAAVATSWNPSPSGPPRYSLSFNSTNESLFSAAATAFASSDAINLSWGFGDPTGTFARTVGLDGLARMHPGTTFVAAAGNAGASGNNVIGPAAGYNSIAVANLANPNLYDTVNTSSSRGPQDYSDPVNGIVPAARVAIDIAAPGTTITAAYYGGETGGNAASLGGSPGGPAGSPTWYANFNGTSFAAPMVTGAAALLDSASYNTPALAGNANSRDARVVKSVLLNSATKIPGWNNGQTTAGGVIATQQALDYAVGAGRLNLRGAYGQYLSGTTDLPGTAGGAVDGSGWDFGAVAPSGVNDYVIAEVLEGGTTFDATLSWFRDRTFIDAATVSDDAYRDLDLEVWDSSFTTLIAKSESRYENVEHLSFLLPTTGQYGLRVRYFQTLFGAAADESYGLAWANSAVPAWAIANAGNWSAGVNWSTGAAPNAVGAAAKLGAAITSPRTVTLDVPVTLASLKFDSDHAYTINGTQSLMLDGTAGTATVEVINGSHVIAAPLTLRDTTDVIVAAGRMLSVSGQLEASGVDVNKSGGGTLVINHVRSSALNVNAGTVRASPDGGTSKVTALTVGSGGGGGAKLDLTNNKMIVAAGDIGTANAGGTYGGLTGKIQSGYNFSAWDGPGITTSMPDAGPLVGTTTLAISTADATFYAGGTFGGVPVASGDVLVMYTYAGDANLDGLIDGADYGLIDNYVQFPGASGYANGDFNYDGVIDGADYGIIDNSIQLQGPPIPAGTYPASAGTVAVAVVPEPASLSVLCVAAASVIGQRSRRSRRGTSRVSS